MSTFKVNARQLLLVLRTGESKLREEIKKQRLYALELVVQKWRNGFTKKNAFDPSQYDWEGEVNLEALDSKYDSLPGDFQSDLASYFNTYCGSLFAELTLLRKYQSICLFAADSIQFDDKEFHSLMCAARHEID